jgi:hypothetical protein
MVFISSEFGGLVDSSAVRSVRIVLPSNVGAKLKLCMTLTNDRAY